MRDDRRKGGAGTERGGPAGANGRREPSGTDNRPGGAGGTSVEPGGAAALRVELAASSGLVRPVAPNPLARAALAVLLAAVLGLAVAHDPLSTVAVFGGAIGMLVALLAPAWICLALLAVTAVSVQYVFPDTALLGMDLLALFKLALLALLVPALLRYGVAWFRLLPLAALAASFALTWLWGRPAEDLAAAASGKALLGLAAPLLIMAVRWPEREAGRLLHVVLFLPVISLAAGLGLQAANLHPVIMREFTGALRLQGANIPAHLAFLAFVALAAAILLWKRRPRRGAFLFGMMAVLFLILLLTGTRGPLIAAVPLVLVFLGDLARQFAKGRSGLLVPFAGIAGLMAGAVVWQWDNLLKRSFFRATAAGIDLSGREEAWRFFLARAEEAPWLGRGLGAVLSANDGTLDPGFAVPHNEYIRFYYDAGLVGATLLFASLLAVFLHAGKGLSRGEKAYGAALVLGFLLYSVSDNTLSTLQFMVPFCTLVGTYGATCRAGLPAPAFAAARDAPPALPGAAAGDAAPPGRPQPAPRGAEAPAGDGGPGQGASPRRPGRGRGRDAHGQD